VFASGDRDYRNGKELSIVKNFFDVNPGVFTFNLKLNVTQSVFDGRKWVSASGASSLKILVNRPPENGTCYIQTRTQERRLTEMRLIAWICSFFFL
jgi:hypothetical protein